MACHLRPLRRWRPLVALSLVALAWSALGAAPARADLALESGVGRQHADFVMLTWFDRDNTPGDWISFDLHVGQFTRDKDERDDFDPATDKNEKETFPFYGFNMAVGHWSLNPYILILLGATQFDKLSGRLGTRWNFHVGLEFGAHGPSFGWFLRAHHWSNGNNVLGSPDPNTGEEFATFGIEWRY